MNSTTHTRTIILFYTLGLCYLIVLGHLAFIQLIHTSFFTTLGSQQYLITINQLPPRGLIIDRTGNHSLALNKECISAFVIPNKLHNKQELSSFLKTNFPASLQRLVDKPESAFCYIKRRLSKEELELIAASHLQDIHLLHETSRFYSMPSASPLIGFTDIDNVGLAGIELFFNDILTGTPTQFTLEKDARSGYFYFNKKVKQTGHESKPIQLTIDANLQFLVDEHVADALERYKAPEAAAIIMDPCTGEILAISSHPFSDPNDSGPSNEALFKQRVVTESYELGSVIKIPAALAALEEGVVTPDELIDCKNRKTCVIDGRIINTVTPNGIIPFHDVIAYSNNIGIAQVAKRVGKKLYDHYRAMGFGQKTGIELPAESKGFVNHPSNWSAQSVISLSYGYEISVTLIQLASFFSMIACDGKKVAPHLIMNDREIKPIQVYSPESIAIIKDMLKKTAEYGTGKKTQLDNFTVMSKTGTANLLIDGAYDQTRHLLSCAGIIEKGDYKRVIVVFIKDPGIYNAYAATVAAPFFKRVAQAMVIHDRVV